MGVQDAFTTLRKRNKIAFAVIVAFAVILFWKGAWNLMDIIFDQWLFAGHLFWSNIAAVIVGVAILSAAGLALDRLV